MKNTHKHPCVIRIIGICAFIIGTSANNAAAARLLSVHNNPHMENTIQTKLENAANGLLMMSEADYPFDYFITDTKTIDEGLVLTLAGKPAGTTIEKISIDYLLRNMTDAATGSVSADVAQKFRNLSAVLKQELTGLTVYRVGDVQVDVFVLGITSEGKIVGMRTKLIET